MTSIPQRSLLAVMVALFVAAVVTATPSQAAATTCTSATPSGAGYSVTVCITAPAPGATLSGDVTVTATATTSSGGPGVARLEFGIDGPAAASPLITDFSSPYTFTLPTAQFVDGAHTLSVHANLRDGNVSQETTQRNTFNNGTTSVPPLPATTRSPVTGTTPAAGAPFVVAAVGDGAGGESNESNVVNLIQSWHPNLLTWLGDVYDNGTFTEFKNWYDPTGYYGAFRSITDPVVGNHEYGDMSSPTKARGYFYYWQNIPHYYSYDAGGWHFIALDSTSQYMGTSGQTQAAQAQFQWFQDDLDANTLPCVAVYYHHPLWTVGPEGPSTRMTPYWSVMASHHVTLVLNGHEHDYQRWAPLDGAGNPDPNCVTEFVSGAGGHSSQPAITTDSRVAYASTSQMYGALRLDLTSSAADFTFVKTTGKATTVLDSGSVPCRGSDGAAPTTPANVTATAASDTSVQVSWAPSTDNVAVTGYDVYRDGGLVATLGAGSGSYLDTGLTPGSTHTYTVDAFDAAANHSAQSSPASVRLPAQDTQAPTTPSNVSATAVSSTRVTVAWAASTDNVGVTGYRIYRDGALVGTAASSARSYDDTTVGGSTSYSYQVSAIDAASNESPLSPAVSVTTPGSDSSAPTVPGSVTASTAPDGSFVTVSLSWSPSSDNVGVTGYDVYRDSTLLGEVSASTTSFTDPAAHGSTAYQYGVVAFDAAGNRSAPGTVDVTTPAATPQTANAPDVADAYVNASSASTNYGANTALRTDGSPQMISYLRFNVTGAQSQISSATLRIYGTSKSQGFSVYAVADPSWGEKTVTYNNRPALGALVATSPADSGAGWVGVDVSSLVTGNGTVDLALVSDAGTQSAYSSREAASNQPVLVVQSFPY
jgi:fibronectin type 3 domain-containing protein